MAATLTTNQLMSVTTPPVVTTLKEPSLPVKLLTAGSAACVADLFTFPLDTAKVRLQVNLIRKWPWPISSSIFTGRIFRLD